MKTTTGRGGETATEAPTKTTRGDVHTAHPTAAVIEKPMIIAVENTEISQTAPIDVDTKTHPQVTENAADDTAIGTRTMTRRDHREDEEAGVHPSPAPLVDDTRAARHPREHRNVLNTRYPPKQTRTTSLTSPRGKEHRQPRQWRRKSPISHLQAA